MEISASAPRLSVYREGVHVHAASTTPFFHRKPAGEDESTTQPELRLHANPERRAEAWAVLCSAQQARSHTPARHSARGTSPQSAPTPAYKTTRPLHPRAASSKLADFLPHPRHALHSHGVEVLTALATDHAPTPCPERHGPSSRPAYSRAKHHGLKSTAPAPGLDSRQNFSDVPDTRAVYESAPTPPYNTTRLSHPPAAASKLADDIWTHPARSRTLEDVQTWKSRS
ncbi:hypothetical protein JB92DRAFT_3129231 [Gautieria morchelliformis]|nr:hypothetical protein JB92DRAFT_3129231 [Gautieria morchelliformis]